MRGGSTFLGDKREIDKEKRVINDIHAFADFLCDVLRLVYGERFFHSGWCNVPLCHEQNQHCNGRQGTINKHISSPVSVKYYSPAL